MKQKRIADVSKFSFGLSLKKVVSSPDRPTVFSSNCSLASTSSSPFFFSFCSWKTWRVKRKKSWMGKGREEGGKLAACLSRFAPTTNENSATVCLSVWPSDGTFFPSLSLSVSLKLYFHFVAAFSSLLLLPPSPTENMEVCIDGLHHTSSDFHRLRIYTLKRLLLFSLRPLHLRKFIPGWDTFFSPFFLWCRPCIQ